MIKIFLCFQMEQKKCDENLMLWNWKNLLLVAYVFND